MNGFLSFAYATALSSGNPKMFIKKNKLKLQNTLPVNSLEPLHEITNSTVFKCIYQWDRYSSVVSKGLSQAM